MGDWRASTSCASWTHSWLETVRPSQQGLRTSRSLPKWQSNTSIQRHAVCACQVRSASLSHGLTSQTLLFNWLSRCCLKRASKSDRISGFPLRGTVWIISTASFPRGHGGGRIQVQVDSKIHCFSVRRLHRGSAVHQGCTIGCTDRLRPRDERCMQSPIDALPAAVKSLLNPYPVTWRTEQYGSISLVTGRACMLKRNGGSQLKSLTS
jgi:hypothetical protein